MKITTRILTAAALLALSALPAHAQDATPIAFTVDPTGRVQVEVESSVEDYFILYFREELPDGPELPVSMALGADGTTTLTESLAAYPQAHYRVQRYDRATPGDWDQDGIDDVEEFENLGRLGPFNAAPEIDAEDGMVTIPDRATFEALSYEGDQVLIDTHLEDLEFVKFYLLNANTDNPTVYFMNTETHRSHGQFARAVGLSQGGGGGRPGGGRGGVPNSMRGEIVYHPNVLGPNGALGVYRWEFEPNDNYPFAEVQMAYEMMARNLPLLQNDWAYYPMPNAALPRYEREKALFDASRVKILLEEDIFADVRYLPLNLAEGYGLLRVMDPNERPGQRDIVLYEALPNEMSRVGGIITTVPQTPLSHVNLRAIQDGVPNAFIADALSDPVIVDLVGKHVYYKVGAQSYEMREATLAEVEAHYAARRPTEAHVPERDLSATEIAPLDQVRFAQWTRYGVKAANMATLRTFGFPEATVQDGFAVPFSYYDAFMIHNGFYDDVRALLADPEFQGDYDVQEEKLKDLRNDIEDGEMPPAMLDALAAMHASYPVGTPLRCRSSTNNEDLPGFSGAGLYDSYTHRPDEGHIEKSIKQVYASLWNFRAFDERQFYRIDHFQTAMGVLVHENFDDELANGVGVSTDPIYQTDDTYYLNTQVGEDLVTNPDALSIPEEILLGSAAGSGFTLVRPSNQVADGVRILSDEYLEQMRAYLGVIDRGFRALYGVAPLAPDFAMEIEYKITAEGDLAIKQARPWVFSGAPTGPVEPPATPTPGATARPPAPTPTAPTGPNAATLYLPLAWNAQP